MYAFLKNQDGWNLTQNSPPPPLLLCKQSVLFRVWLTPFLCGLQGLFFPIKENYLLLFGQSLQVPYMKLQHLCLMSWLLTQSGISFHTVQCVLMVPFSSLHTNGIFSCGVTWNPWYTITSLETLLHSRAIFISYAHPCPQWHCDVYSHVWATKQTAEWTLTAMNV